VTKSGQKSKILKKWKFEDELQFLKSHMKERESMSNIDTVSNDDEELFEEDNETCFFPKRTLNLILILPAMILILII
jgi:hypothetical protein